MPLFSEKGGSLKKTEKGKFFKLSKVKCVEKWKKKKKNIVGDRVKLTPHDSPQKH